jgi:tetratricopeptide (TPR) repeat protein
MMPGQIYRTNEILCHLGEEYYTWQSVCDSIKIIKRKQKKIQQQIKEEEDQYQVFVQKKNPFVALKQIYDEEKIKEIQETEEENEFYESQAIEKATQEDFDQYFEIEKEEENHIQQQQQILGSWEEMMQRMEALEALEEKKTIDSLEKQVDEFKSKGNQAFSSRNFQKAVDLYTKAIQLDPINHVCIFLYTLVIYTYYVQ